MSAVGEKPWPSKARIGAFPHISRDDSLCFRRLVLEPHCGYRSVGILGDGSDDDTHGPMTMLLERQAQLDQLEELLAAAARGRGRVAALLGEAGAGKTALVEAFV